MEHTDNGRQKSGSFSKRRSEEKISERNSRHENMTESVRKYNQESEDYSDRNLCPYRRKCGGCDYQGMSYPLQLKEKEKEVRELLSPFCKTMPIQGMEEPLRYRHKVHAVLTRGRKGEILSGVYEENSHHVVPIDDCLIENQTAEAIIQDLKKLIADFKMKIYDEDTGYGLLRHIMVRVGYATGEVMVILVLVSPILPNKNNFLKALLKLHPEITTVVLNINDRHTSMVLGTRDIVLYGKGYIEDSLCGCTFRLSPQSFYQVNPVQTEKLYQKAMELAHLSGSETVADAYCGTGTIGLIASKMAGQVIGVELNPEAVKDAVSNARRNKAENIRFFCDDAPRFLDRMSSQKQKLDVLFMDPPRSGSTEIFLRSAARLAPDRIVYISCNPETLARDLQVMTRLGYKAQEAWPFDLFPFTKHVETAVLICRKNG